VAEMAGAQNTLAKKNQIWWNHFIASWDRTYAGYSAGPGETTNQWQAT